MCREPVFDSFVEDFIKDCQILEKKGDKLLSFDWYDSHVLPESLVKLFDANVFTIFTENDCTDILAMPDGGAIRTLKHRIDTIIEATVDKDIDTWFRVTPPSKSFRRRTCLNALSEAWSWFKEEHRSTPFRIGLRTGKIVKLYDDRILQFKETRYRGYENEDKTPKNPFSEMTFAEAHADYVKRNAKRRSDRASRKRKKLEKEEDEKRKKELKKNQKLKRKRKSKKKIKIEEESKEPIISPVVKVEPVTVPQFAPLIVKKEKRTFQKEVFEDERVAVDDFLDNM